MMLSKMTASILVDLVENKLAMLQIDDRNDLREVLALQRCLGELRGSVTTDGASAGEFCDIPHRGRHRKLTALMEDMNVMPTEHRQSA